MNVYIFIRCDADGIGRDAFAGARMFHCKQSARLGSEIT